MATAAYSTAVRHILGEGHDVWAVGECAHAWGNEAQTFVNVGEAVQSGHRFDALIDIGGDDDARTAQRIPELWPLLMPGGQMFLGCLADKPGVVARLGAWSERVLRVQWAARDAPPADIELIMCQAAVCAVGKQREAGGSMWEPW